MIQTIQEVTAHHFKLSMKDLLSKKREEKIFIARDIAMFYCFRLSGMACEDIANAFGLENSTDVAWHVHKLKEFTQVSPHILLDIQHVAVLLYDRVRKQVTDSRDENYWEVQVWLAEISEIRKDTAGSIRDYKSKRTGNTTQQRRTRNTSSDKMKATTVKKEKAKEEKSGRTQLKELIGFEENKELTRKIINSFSHQKMREKHGLKTNKTSMHMVFTGNAGTGKTTFARIISKILKEEGILSKGDFIEVGRGDLIGEYVGQTAPKVIEAFERAKGSVLFIDEAYSLLSKDGFSQEAIATIVQEMENNREDTVVIFAGYKKATEEMLASNDGLKSRIAFTLDFPDYNADELMEITQMMIKKLDYQLTDEVTRLLADFYKKTDFDEKSGNARMVRNILEKAIINQADRIQENLRGNAELTISKEELLLLEVADFAEVLSGFVRKNVSEDVVIGFRQPKLSASTYKRAEEMPLKEVALSC
jgi:AAA+ superfamily predicted ATPase